MALRHRIARSVRRWLWERRLPHLPATPDGKRLLHIGCGDVDAPHYINLDARRFPHVHIVTERVTDLRMIPDASLDLVYMCHILEHVGRYDAIGTILEMARVLKPGGTLRIAVPDFDLILAIYERSGHDIATIAPPLMGGQDYPHNFHYGVFNAASLTHLFQRGGFTNVRRWDPATAKHHGFSDWSSGTVPYNGQEFPISLNLEATRS
jgi:predicted SAM-dependent methyltransferase